MIGLYIWIQWETKSKTNHIKEFYNSCKAAFSAERNK